MSNYIPNNQKKNKIFRKREVELRHAIRNKAEPDKLEKAVNRLRQAKLAAYKAQLSVRRDRNIVRAREKWKRLTREEIVVKYSKGET